MTNKLTTLIALAATSAFAADTKPAVQKMPEVTITDSNLLTEERAIGETGRPEWTSARRFPTTRVYIQKEPWQVGVETWWRFRDMAVQGDRSSRTEDYAVELRYALADWGKLPLNPTLYAEYKFVEEGADVVELKLLLGDQLPGGWHYGAYFVWEKELAGERTTEWQLVTGVSKTLIDGRLSLGVEGKYVHETTTTSRGEPEHKILVGPSTQWRLNEKFSVSTTVLFGLTDDAPHEECWLILSYDFGKSAESKYKPISGRR